MLEEMEEHTSGGIIVDNLFSLPSCYLYDFPIFPADCKFCELPLITFRGGA